MNYWDLPLRVSFTSISCITFERFACFLEFSVKLSLTSAKLLHYLDDVLGGDISEVACSHALQIFRNTMSELGVLLAEEKNGRSDKYINIFRFTIRYHPNAGAYTRY